MNFPKSSQPSDLARAMSYGAPASQPRSDASEPRNAAQARRVTTGPSGVENSLQLSRAQSAQDIVCADERPLERTEVEITTVLPDETPPGITEQDIRGRLVLAARHGNSATAKAMALRLGSPSEINRSHELGDTPLLLAVRNQHPETVKVFTQLLGSLSKLHIVDAVGSTPLMIATNNCDVETARVLLDAGAPLHAQDQIGLNAIMKAAGQPSKLPHETLIEFLIERLLDSEEFRALA